MIETHTVSLPLAKIMRDMGFPQTSEFRWVCQRGRPNMGDKPNWYILETERTYNFTGKNKASCYLATELAEWLPNNIIMGKRKADWFIDDDVYATSGKKFEDKSLPDAMAKMLIYLAKNNLLDPSTLKGAT